MRSAPVEVSSSDAALLEAVERLGNVVRAAREVGMGRDRAVYRLERIGRAFGGPVVAARRGGRAHGESRLTVLGARILRRGFSTVEVREGSEALLPAGVNLFHGRFSIGPPPSVVIAEGGPRVRVAFAAEDGETVGLRLDPESVLLARGRFPSSARNVLSAVVERNAPRGTEGRWLAPLRVGATRVWAWVTGETVRELGLARGRRVYLYVKATALRPVAETARSSPARLRSRGRRPPRPRGGSASRSGARSASAASTS